MHANVQGILPNKEEAHQSLGVQEFYWGLVMQEWLTTYIPSRDQADST